MANILGIDPGLTGGLALLDSTGVLITAERMPVLKLNGKGCINLATVAARLDEWKPSQVWIEQQQSMPRQGVASSFLTGNNYGELRGFIYGFGYKYETVNPRQWKRALSVPADKKAAMIIANRMFPNGYSFWTSASHDGLAEAALIALYGWRQSKPQPLTITIS